MRRGKRIRSTPTVVDGFRFDSRREAGRYKELKALQRAGLIKQLTLQPRFPIVIGGVEVKYPSGRKLTYVADFAYIEGGKEVIEDCKGHKTEVYKIKRALMLAMGKEIRET